MQETIEIKQDMLITPTVTNYENQKGVFKTPRLDLGGQTVPDICTFLDT